MKTYDCIVVGAGIAGLTAATTLVAEGQSVLVLEARDRVGGRTCAVVAEDGHAVDLGGAYVGPTQNRILHLADQLKLSTYKVHTAGKTVQDVCETRAEYTGVIPPLSLAATLDLNRILVDTDALASTVRRDAPWSSAGAHAMDRETVWSWLEKRAYTPVAKALFSIAVRTVLCAEMHQVSLLFFAFYVKSAGGVVRLIENENGAQERKFSEGAWSISERMAKQLGTAVRLASPVTSLDTSADYTHVTCADGSCFAARRVVCAVPPTLVQKIAFSPALPALKRQLIQRMPMGCIIKTVMVYKRAFWREKGYNGMIVSDSRAGPVSVSYDDCTPDGTHCALMGFVLAHDASRFVSASDAQLRDAICRQYAQFFKDDAAFMPTQFIHKRWNEEEWSGGCYVGHMAAGTMTECGAALRMRHGGVHFAGTETATEWMGYMDGAVQSGQRAAAEILVEMGVVTQGDAEVRLLSGPPEGATVGGVEVRETGPTALEKMLPGVPGAAAVLAVAVGAAAWCIARWTS